MIIIRTDTQDQKVKRLISLLDQSLRASYGDYQDNYAPHNQFEEPIKAILLVENHQAVACGAFKEFPEKKDIEVKRMFVHPDYRGKGLSKIVLSNLESWAKELGYRRAILETGTKQFAAIHLYRKTGYSDIPCYGPYVGLLYSICMEKPL